MKLGADSHSETEILYRAPLDLSVTPVTLKRILLIGSCMTVGWPTFIKSITPDCECDFLLMNNAPQFPEIMPAPVEDYDFQLLQIPLRILVPEKAYFHLSYHDVAAYQTLFDDAVERLRQFMAEGMRWNVEHGLLTFVFNFLPPQQNSMGRLLPRYDLRNFVFFVEELNRVLAAEIARYSNAYVFDFNQVVCTYGRKFFQDDAVYHSSHASVLTDFDFGKDRNRLEPVVKMKRVYVNKSKLVQAAAWQEILACYRTVRQLDMVKLVIVDIDDTLWRGVAAEHADAPSPRVVEGWPLGFMEALLCLKRRGVLLAIVSKNEEATIERIFDKITARHIRLEDFAIRKINWNPKADNVEQVLAEANLLARNTVFIDDNPVERAAVCSAFPDIRSFGANPYIWRRLLLWSAETQVASVTAESAARTQMVQKQVQRETERKQLSRADFLASLNLKVEVREIVSADTPSFPRLFELLNKTNQFNTTGKRWSRPACADFIKAGGQFFVFSAEDRFTEYGIVGVVITKGADIVQFVMSCRVVGMDVELAVLAEILNGFARSGATRSTAASINTELNLLSRDLFLRCGFAKEGDVWTRSLEAPLETPAHLRMAA